MHICDGVMDLWSSSIKSSCNQNFDGLQKSNIVL